MSVVATRTTSSMLAEIQTGTAAETVLAVRYNTSPPGPVFIPSLDELLLQARPHVGSSSLQRGDLVELVGPSGSGMVPSSSSPHPHVLSADVLDNGCDSGKTTFINFLLLTTLLPSSVKVVDPATRQPQEIPLGGRNQYAQFIHPSSHPSILPRLVSSLRSHITLCLADHHLPSARQEKLVEEIINQSLSRLTIIKVKPRWKGWFLALSSVLQPLDGRVGDDEVKKASGGVGIVVCDGFSDGFWIERWFEELNFNAGGVGPGAQRKRDKLAVRNGDDISLRDVWELIDRIRKELGSVFVLSTQGLWLAQKSILYTSHLPPPYPAPFIPPKQDPTMNDLLPDQSDFWPLNIQLTFLGPKRGLQFPPETGLVRALESLHSTDMEDDAGVGGRWFEGVLRVPGAAGGAGMIGGERWGFRIGEAGLEAWG